MAAADRDMSSIPPDKAGDGYGEDVRDHNDGGSEPPTAVSAGGEDPLLMLEQSTPLTQQGPAGA